MKRNRQKHWKQKNRLNLNIVARMSKYWWYVSNILFVFLHFVNVHYLFCNFEYLPFVLILSLYFTSIYVKYCSTFELWEIDLFSQKYWDPFSFYAMVGINETGEHEVWYGVTRNEKQINYEMYQPPSAYCVIVDDLPEFKKYKQDSNLM